MSDDFSYAFHGKNRGALSEQRIFVEKSLVALFISFRIKSVLWKEGRVMVPSGNKPSRSRLPRRRRTPVRNTTSVLDLVRAEVERFVLRDANMMSFQKAIRAAAKKGEKSTHPLTGAAFRRIVKDAIRERNMRIGRGLHGQTESSGERCK